MIDESEEDDSYYDEEQESREDRLTVIVDVADNSLAASTVKGGLEKKTEATLVSHKAEANICQQSEPQEQVENRSNSNQSTYKAQLSTAKQSRLNSRRLNHASTLPLEPVTEVHRREEQGPFARVVKR